ncbi:BEN domain-containing protein 5 [Armadillidium vulgare]|nr:BEN domain-containing protein 5 [Armadillidium vulgare]
MFFSLFNLQQYFKRCQNLFAYVQFLDDKSRNVVPEDDQANLQKYERSIYEGTILDLGASKESFLKQKRIASVPFSMLESPSETEFDDPSSKILSMGNALPQAKTIDLLQTMKKNLTQTSKISSDSEYSSDGEVYLPKRKVYEYENKIINQKKKIKTLQNEMEVLKSRNAYLETDYDTLKEKLNRYESNAGIEESSCKEMLKVLLQETTEIKASLKTTLEEPSSRNKNKGNEIIFGSISFPEKPFLTISRRPKNSLFVKDLVSLLWSDEDLSQRSLTGKKHYNSKEIKQPLTPEKRFAIEEAFKDRLKKQQYHDAMIALELKLVNRYIAEKINDVKKCKSRRNLNMTYDIQNKNIPREEEKDLSENEPISNDMIN